MEEKKLNIGLFIDTYYPMIDGVVTVVDNYAKRLVKYANVTVFTIAPRDKDYVDNFAYKVVRCQKLDIPGLDYDLAMPSFDMNFAKELKNAKLDIVHIHSPFSIGKAGANYAKKHKLPCVATNHSQFKQDFFKATKSPAITDLLVRGIVNVFNKCDENWSVNEMTSDLFFNEYGLKNKPLVVPNGTDFYCGDYDKYNCDINKKYSLTDKDKILLYVGRMVDLKNIPFIIESFNLLLKEDDTFKLMFVGDGIDIKKHKKMVKDLNLENNVIFAGKVADRKLLGSIYKRADLFVFASRYDTDGLVKKEAAAFKTPTLAIKNSFPSSEITDGINGYTANFDVVDFKNKILEIFKDEENYKKVCEQCLKDIYKNWDDIIESVFEKYKALIKQKKIENAAIHKKAQYTKTIQNVQKQTLKNKQKQSKKQAKIRRKMQKYPKTLKNIREKQKMLN